MKSYVYLGIGGEKIGERRLERGRGYSLKWSYASGKFSVLSFSNYVISTHIYLKNFIVLSVILS